MRGLPAVLAAVLGSSLVVYSLLWCAVGAPSLGSPPAAGRLIPENDTVTIELPANQRESGLATSGGVFRLVNRGGSPVSIRSVRSACDCAVARVDPMVVAPGSTSIVEIVGKPSESSDRMVAVTLATDSAETPEVHLHVRLKGTKAPTPPYLIAASGDLTYHGTFSESDEREIKVLTIQNTGRREEAKIVSTVPATRIVLIDTDAAATTEPAFSIVTHTYSVRLQSRPKGGERLEGLVVVQDPWDESRQEKIQVFGEFRDAFSVCPTRLLLCWESPGESGILQVYHQGSGAVPTVEVDSAAAGLLNVKLLRGEAPEPDCSFFEVRLNSTSQRKPEGVFHLSVRPEPKLPERIVVPVKVVGEHRS